MQERGNNLESLLSLQTIVLSVKKRSVAIASLLLFLQFGNAIWEYSRVTNYVHEYARDDSCTRVTAVHIMKNCKHTPCRSIRTEQLRKTRCNGSEKCEES